MPRDRERFGYVHAMSSRGRGRAGTVPFTDAWSGASQTAVGSIPDLLRGLEAVVVAVIDGNGELKDANRGFLMLMTRATVTTPPADVRSLFLTPAFTDLAQRRVDPFEGTIYRGLLSFGGAGCRSISLRGAVYRHESDYVVVAEHDIVGPETLRTTLLELQDDLADKQRHIVHLEHRLARLQELCDAALRDRDTLLDALDHSALAKPRQDRP